MRVLFGQLVAKCAARHGQVLQRAWGKVGLGVPVVCATTAQTNTLRNISSKVWRLGGAKWCIKACGYFLASSWQNALHGMGKYHGGRGAKWGKVALGEPIRCAATAQTLTSRASAVKCGAWGCKVVF